MLCIDLDLYSLAKKADDVNENLSSKHVAAISNASNPPFEVNEPLYVAELREMIEQIQREFKSGRRGNRSRSASRRRNESSENTDGLCWYHREFGDNARNCREPCKRYAEFAAKFNDKSKN